MKRFLLIREKPEAERTQGALHYGSQLIGFTMEPGLEDKAARVAPGFYICEPHGWEPASPLRFRQTWALVGHDVSHQPEPGVARSAVLLHQGNRDDDTRGCILLGLRRGVLGGEPAVFDSLVAMDRLRDLVGNNAFGLSIMEG